MRQPPGAATYDAVPYPGQPFAQTHPDRLATLAALFGLEAAPPAGCRLLEIGCGDGGNLLPMALGLPEASFVGFDSSPAAIARAREGAAAAGLRSRRRYALHVVRTPLLSAARSSLRPPSVSPSTRICG